MNIVGWILAVFGFVGVVFGIRMMLKGKKMGSVPFRKPSEIAQQGAQAADAKGMVSTEGQVVASGQPLIAPMSGKPCLGYEIVVERKWEKTVKTEKGHEKKTGTTKAFSEYKGTTFQISDGSGQVLVDSTTQPDVSLDKTHSSTVNVSMVLPGMLTFGNLQMNTPSVGNMEGSTTGYVGTEKIISPSATLYALGAYAQGPQGLAIGTPKGIGTGKLILSSKGREHLVGTTKRNMILGYALGGVMLVGGSGLGLFGPKAEATGCEANLAKSATTSCDDRIVSDNGKDIKWTVTEAATYRVSLKQPAVKNPIDGVVEITDSTGKKVAYDDGGSASTNASITQTFAPGTYSINVRDFAKHTLEGGYGFHLDIEKVAGEPTPELSQASLTGTLAPAMLTAKGAAAAGAAGAAGAKAAPKPSTATPAAAASAAGKPASSATTPAPTPVATAGKPATAPSAPAAAPAASAKPAASAAAPAAPKPGAPAASAKK